MNSPTTPLTVSLESAATGDGTDSATQNDKPKPSKLMRVLKIYAKLVKLVLLICLTFILLGGFSMYVFVSSTLFISPYFGLVSGIGLSNGLQIAVCVIFLVVGYPIMEIIMIIPAGIYKLQFFDRNLKAISPIHFIADYTDKAVQVVHQRPMYTIGLLLATTAIGAFLITIFANYSSNAWAAVILMVMVFFPFLIGVRTLFTIIYKGWKRMIVPNSEFSFKPEQVSEDNPDGTQWPFIGEWLNFIDDPKTDPINLLRNGNLDGLVDLVFLLLYLAMLALMITILAKQFTWPFFGMTIFVIVICPILVRFNLPSRFLSGKWKFEHHKRFRRISKWTLGISIFIFVLFMIYIIGFCVDYPVRPPIYTSIVPEDQPVPVFNVSLRNELPMYCTKAIQGLSSLQLMMVADAAFDLDTPVFWEKMKIAFGGNASLFVTVEDVVSSDLIRAGLIHHNRLNLSIITIKSSSTLADSALLYSFDTLYTLPETLYMQIPFAKRLFGPLIAYLQPFFDFPSKIMSPYSLQNQYITPVIPLIEKTMDNSLIIGHGVGGAAAKIISSKVRAKAVSYNSPEVRMWYLGELFNKKSTTNEFMNILSWQEKRTGAETGGNVEYIPFGPIVQGSGRDDETYSNSAQMLCMMALQCEEYEYFQDYCEVSVGLPFIEELRHRLFTED